LRRVHAGSEAGSRGGGNRQRLRSISSTSHWILISAFSVPCSANSPSRRSVLAQSEALRGGKSGFQFFPPGHRVTAGAQDRGRLVKGWRLNTRAQRIEHPLRRILLQNLNPCNKMLLRIGNFV
jgi:hypothetical protein